jgi:aminopeptidase N
VRRLLCHEVSHQWFGDLVTPLSFDELWLKESTARLFEVRKIDILIFKYV